MKWTEERDLVLCREILTFELYQYKIGTTETGNLWHMIEKGLNETKKPKFQVTQKGVRDRFSLIMKKRKAKE